MLRPIVALTAAAFVAIPAAAATYSAKPASPAKAERIAVRDLVWACGPVNCTGSTQNSRPLVLCQGLAKRAGRLESFAVNGRPFDADELERCNASAPAANDPALANAR